MSSLAFLGPIGMPELVVIFVVVLLIFGPKALPKLARSLGSSIREFKDATSKMSESIMDEDEDEEPRQKKKPDAVEGQKTQSSSTESKESETNKASSSS